MGIIQKTTENMKKGFTYWISFPDPSEDHDDDVWHHFEPFSGEWLEIQNRKDWYESPHVPDIYQDHKYIFDKNMSMNKPEEKFFHQNVDNNEFESKMVVTEDLPSTKGEMKIETNISTKSPPSGENDFCMVEYYVHTYIRYDVPNGVKWLPRFLARPLNRFFKWAFWWVLAEDMVDRDGEYARERTTEYFQYIRKYHGEEPMQSRTRQSEFESMPDEGIFFQ